jgi:hypothetical protein
MQSVSTVSKRPDPPISQALQIRHPERVLPPGTCPSTIHRTALYFYFFEVPYCCLFGDMVGDGAVTNRVTMVQTAKKTPPNAWQVHLIDMRAALALLRVIGWHKMDGIRCMQDQRDSFALGRVAFGCSARPEKCEKCDHFAGPCDPGSQPNRAPRPSWIPSLLQT